MRKDVKLFVKRCIHCFFTTGGSKAPSLFGPVVHGSSRSNVAQFDHPNIGYCSSGDKYILMNSDNNSVSCAVIRNVNAVRPPTLNVDLQQFSVPTVSLEGL